MVFPTNCYCFNLQQCCYFSFAEIQSATKNFDDQLVIGHGGFGKVYKGCISINKSSHVVAVKRLDSMSDQGASEFRAEIEMLSKLRHCHLVSLIGFCDDNKEMILVYDYMPNGSLHDRLHKVDTPLSWVQRLKIGIGAARGLDYLHTGIGTQHGVIHRDIKSSNILLDENCAAMISDFGLSKLGPTNQSSSYIDASVKGTFGYLDPEYFYTSRLTRKTDVFAFGVVLFEMLSGRLPVDMRHGEEHCSLVRWAQKCVKLQKVDQLVDSSIKGTIFPECLSRFAHIAYRCILNVPKERPPMTNVVASLLALLELQNKHDHSFKPPHIMGLTSKTHKYFLTAFQQDLSCTSSAKSLENNMNQHEELVIRDVKMFTYDELKHVTSGFGNDRCLGEDDHGKVYKGWVDKTTYTPCKHNALMPVTVKKLHRYKHFDLGVLKKSWHPNHVELIGYCLEDEQLFLVYEFMHGNFEYLIRTGTVAQLPLVTKVKIALGIARGIKFLTTFYESDRRNQRLVESSDYVLERHKILLDKDFTAKLSDYDISILVDGRYPKVLEHLYDCDDPGLKPIELRCSLSGFKVVFSEVITGVQISNFHELRKITRFFCHYWKEDLREIAIFCYESCNEVDSE